MQYSQAPCPLSDQRAPVICTGFPTPRLVGIVLTVLTMKISLLGCEDVWSGTRAPVFPGNMLSPLVY